MARIRTIKPEFWSHTVLGRLPDASKLLALALLNFSDDEGYFPADPALVRNFARPFDVDCEIVTESLHDLSRAGWIQVRQHSDHGPIGLVVKFKDHQVISHARPSSIKKYFASSDSDPVPLHESADPEWNGSGSGKEKDMSSPESGNSTAPALNGKQEAERFGTGVREVFEHWRTRLKKPATAMLDDPRRRRVEGRLRDGFTVAQLMAAIDGCARSKFHQGENDRGRKYDDLGLICRDAAHVEQFMALAGNGAARATGPQPTRPATPAELDAAITREAMQEIERRKAANAGPGQH